MRRRPVTKGTEDKKNTGEFEVVSMQFADSVIPKMEKNLSQPWVNFGEKNNYPEYIMWLLRKSAKHAAIIKGKVTYIFGNGLKGENDTPQSIAFLDKANEKQSWNTVAKKLCHDIENHGGFYLQVIPKMGGAGYNYYHAPFKLWRTNESETEFYYKKDWSKGYSVPETFKKFVPGAKEATIFYFKEYNPDGDVYPLPSWVPCCNWIESDIEVSKHTLTNAKTGFSASKMINFFNGEPSEEKKKSIQRRFENGYTGAEGKKLIIGYNNDPAKAPTVNDLGASDMTKEDFTAQDNLITNNLFAGHGVTHPLLFGIQQEGKLGSATELKVAFDIFKNTYANEKQLQLEDVVNYFAGLAGVTERIKLQDIEAIGYAFTLTDFKELIPQAWVFEKLGIDGAKYGIAPALPAPAPGAAPATPDPNQQQAATNSILTNLTAKQHQQISRIVRQYGKGQLTKEQAALMLKSGFAFSDEEVNLYLGIDADSTTADAKFNQEFNEIDVALMFSEVGEARENFTIIKSKSFSEDDEEFAFAFGAAAELSELEKQVVDLIKKNPAITAAAIAVAVNQTIAVIDVIVKKLEADNLISAAGTGGIRKLLTPTKKPAAPELLVRYSYEKRPEAAGPELLPTSRPFCVKLIGQDRLYSRKEIQSISERLGYSVFNRAGGFWNHDGKTDSKCRHEWRSQIVIKKK